MGKSKIDFWPRPQLFEAVVDMFTHWRWNRIVLVYEGDESKILIFIFFTPKQISVLRIKNKNSFYAKFIIFHTPPL